MGGRVGGCSRDGDSPLPHASAGQRDFDQPHRLHLRLDQGTRPQGQARRQRRTCQVLRESGSSLRRDDRERIHDQGFGHLRQRKRVKYFSRRLFEHFRVFGQTGGKSPHQDGGLAGRRMALNDGLKREKLSERRLKAKKSLRNGGSTQKKKSLLYSTIPDEILILILDEILA